jgi:hypothetical protein
VFGKKNSLGWEAVSPDVHLHNSGLLYAINKIILHPLGYALSVTFDNLPDGSLVPNSERMELLKANEPITFDTDTEETGWHKLVSNKRLDKLRNQLFDYLPSGGRPWRRFLVLTTKYDKHVQWSTVQALDFRGARELLRCDAISEDPKHVVLDNLVSVRLFEIGDDEVLPLAGWIEQRHEARHRREQELKDEEERALYEKLKRKFEPK